MEGLIEKGDYLSKPVKWGVKEYGSENKLAGWIKFENGLSWQGYPEGNGKAAELFINAIKACGFKGKTLKEFAQNPMSLDTSKIVEITVDHDEWSDKMTGETKKVAKVVWIGGNEYSDVFLKRLEDYEIFQENDF